MIRGDDEVQPVPRVRTPKNQVSEAYAMKSGDEDSASVIAEDPHHIRRPSSPQKTFVIVKTKVNHQLSVSSCICGPGRCVCSFLHLFCPTEFSDGVFSEAYERAVMRTILVAKVIDRAGPHSMYSAIRLCSTNQTKIPERLLLGEWPSPCRKRA